MNKSFLNFFRNFLLSLNSFIAQIEQIWVLKDNFDLCLFQLTRSNCFEESRRLVRKQVVMASQIILFFLHSQLQNLEIFNYKWQSMKAKQFSCFIAMNNKFISTFNPEKNKKKRAELDPKQAEAFLSRPVQKLENLNQSLRKSYQKGFFNKPQFQHFKILKAKRQNKDNDSIKSSDNEKDSDFEVHQNQRRQRTKRTNRRDDSSESQKAPRGLKPIRSNKIKQQFIKNEAKSQQPKTTKSLETNNQNKKLEKKVIKNNLKVIQQSKKKQSKKIIQVYSEKIKPQFKQKQIQKQKKSKQQQSQSEQCQYSDEQQQSSRSQASQETEVAPLKQLQKSQIVKTQKQKANRQKQEQIRLNSKSKQNHTLTHKNLQQASEKKSSSQQYYRPNFQQLNKLKSNQSSDAVVHMPQKTQREVIDYQSEDESPSEESVSSQDSSQSLIKQKIAAAEAEKQKLVQNGQKLCTRVYKEKNVSSQSEKSKQNSLQSAKQLNPSQIKKITIQTQFKQLSEIKQQKEMNLKRSHQQYLQTNVKPKLSLQTRNLSECYVIRVSNKPVSNLQLFQQQMKKVNLFFSHSPCCPHHFSSPHLVKGKKIVERDMQEQQVSPQRQNSDIKQNNGSTNDINQSQSHRLQVKD